MDETGAAILSSDTINRRYPLRPIRLTTGQQDKGNRRRGAIMVVKANLWSFKGVRQKDKP